MLDGEFAFIIVDNRGDDKQIMVARDRYGVRPLFIGYDMITDSIDERHDMVTDSIDKCHETIGNIVISSELKGMVSLVTGGKPSRDFLPSDPRN